MELNPESGMGMPFRAELVREHATEIGMDLVFSPSGRVRSCLTASEQQRDATWNSAGEPEQRLMMPLEHREGRAAFAQPQGEAPSMLNHPGRDADDLLHHRADSPPFGGVAHRAVRADQGRLADGAQEVEGQHRQGQHQIVGGDLPDGSRSRSRSVLNSEWNCSRVPCPW